MNKLFSNKEWNVPRPFGQALRVTRKGNRRMSHPRWGSLSQKNVFFRCHSDEGRISEPYRKWYRNHTENNIIGEKVLDLRSRMTGPIITFRTDSSLIVQN